MPKRCKLSRSEIKNRSIELRKQGWLVKEIARELHCRYQPILEAIREANLVNIGRFWIRKTPSVKIPDEKWKLAYLAGLIDGEGTIHLRRSRGKRVSYLKVQVNITNTSKELLDWILLNFGGRFSSRGPNPKIRKKRIYIWSISRTLDSYLILKAVLPFLLIKKNLAIKALESLEPVLKLKNLL